MGGGSDILDPASINHLPTHGDAVVIERFSPPSAHPTSRTFRNKGAFFLPVWMIEASPILSTQKSAMAHKELFDLGGTAATSLETAASW